MGLDALLTRLENRATDTLETPCVSRGVSAKPAPVLACTLDTSDTQPMGNVINPVVEHVAADVCSEILTGGDEAKIRE